MANRTQPGVKSVHGTDPQFLLEKITRTKIYNSTFWKERCFGQSAEGIVELAMELECFGGSYGGTRKPTHFLCLLLKMLQIQPDKEIVYEFIKNEDYRYVRLLGAFYLRMIGNPKEIYHYLEPLYNDYRRVRKQSDEGYIMLYLDEVVDEILTEPFSCDLQLPRLVKRSTLEASDQLAPRRSALEDDMELLESGLMAEDEKERLEEERKAKEQKKTKKDAESGTGAQYSSEDPEIIAANELRAKLGLKPLQI